MKGSQFVEIKSQIMNFVIIISLTKVKISENKQNFHTLPPLYNFSTNVYELQQRICTNFGHGCVGNVVIIPIINTTSLSYIQIIIVSE